MNRLLLSISFPKLTIMGAVQNVQPSLEKVVELISVI